ncbi:MAG: helix-turn-helix transcriptional regulator [Syntrophales bacterium]|nr:helix-turn-helix transcriptional regulator [Syntrophales bacterium]
MIEQKEGIEIALQERIKELNCLYEMARLAEQHHDSMEDFLKYLVDFLPLSWRYAEVACARIIFQGEKFDSRNFGWTEWRQSAQIRVGDKSVGTVMIIYMEERPRADNGPFFKEERSLLEGIAQRIGEIALRIVAEQELQENNRQLLLERKALQEANAALRVVLANIEDEKKRIYEKFHLNIEKVVMPIIHALKPSIAKNKQKYLDILTTNLEEITTPFTSRILNYYSTLTPTEVGVCNMILNGLRTKEIAQLRGVSTATISRHREHIRRKLKIANQQINLTTYLQSLLAPDPYDLPEANR